MIEFLIIFTIIGIFYLVMLVNIFLITGLSFFVSYIITLYLNKYNII